jgi:TolA-binding protein
MQKIIILFVLGLTLSGCFKTRNDISEEENKKAVQQEVTRLQKNTADAESRFGEINDEIRNLNGKIETLDNKIQTNAQNRDKSQGLADQQLAETNKRVMALQEEMQKIESQMKFLSDEMVKISSSQATAATAALSSDAGKKTDYFKSAEAFFAKKKWKEAATYYEKYRSSEPNGKKFGLATLRIGIAFQELGLKDDAKTFFDDVVDKYPHTALAKLAKDRLKKK